jgi:hypothetical protein
VPTKERRTYRLIKARQEFKRRRGNRCEYCGWKPKRRADARFLDVHNPSGGYHGFPKPPDKVACKWCHGRRSQGKKTKRRG